MGHVLRHDFVWRRPAEGRFAARLRPLAMPAAIAALALALRLYGLGERPLWLDEIYTLKRAAMPLGELIADAIVNLHSPLYFVFVSWLLPLGTTEWMLRLPSAVFGAVAAGMTGAVGRIVGGERVGAVAGLLMALSPYQVLYGQEARSYALLTCLVVIALWALVRLAADPVSAARPLWRRDALHGPWTAYVLGTATALNTLNAAAPWLLAANLAAVAIVAAAGPARWPFVRQWLLAQAAIVLLWLPYLLIALAPVKDAAQGRFWVPPATVDFIASAFSAVYLFRASDAVMFYLGPKPVPLLGSVLIALAVLGAWRLRQRPVLLTAVGLAFVVLPATLLLVSLRQPVFLPRYLIWSAAPFFILVASGLAAFRFRAFAGALALLVVLGGWALHNQYRYESKPRWDWAAVHIASLARPGDVVLLTSYWKRLVFMTAVGRVGLDPAALAIVETVDEARAALAAGRRVWAVQGRVGFGTSPTRQAFIESLAPLGEPQRTYDYGRSVYALRFDGRSDRPALQGLGR